MPKPPLLSRSLRSLQRAQRACTRCADAGYITRQRNGRRNHYTINAHLPLPDPIAREQNIGALLKILTATPASPRPADRARTAT